MDDSLLVVKNVLYSVNPEGTVSARNAQTGQLLWQTHLHQPASAAAIIGRLMFLDGSLFVGAVYPEQKPVFLLHAFNTTSHKEDWYANLSEDGSQEGLITETT